MNAAVALRPVANLNPEVIANIVTNGDLSGLTPNDRVGYYNYRCAQAGLDPAAKPFDLLKLNGKLVLYANASCTQQLCGIHKLSVEIVASTKVDDLYIVQARVRSPDGRSSDNMGAVPISSLKGEALANAMLKATTKAIRRTVLAHIGLGMLDETEVVTIPNVERIPMDVNPRGDLSEVDTKMRDTHVAAIADILATDADEMQIADMLRNYVAERLQQFPEMYISVADGLAEQEVITKANFKKYLKIGLEPRR